MIIIDQPALLWQFFAPAIYATAVGIIAWGVMAVVFFREERRQKIRKAESNKTCRPPMVNVTRWNAGDDTPRIASRGKAGPTGL